MEAAGIACPSESTCTGRAAVGVPLEATAVPHDPLTDLVVWNAPSTCSGLACAALETNLFEVTFVPRVSLELVADGDGSGSALVNGAHVALPHSELVPVGDTVEVVGVPGPDDVVVGFEGLDCAPARRVEDCHVRVAGATFGAIRFGRFDDWLHGAGEATPTDIVARGAGFLVAFSYGANGTAWLPPTTVLQGAAVVEVGLDGGLGRVSAASGRALAPPRFIQKADGGLIVAGPMSQSLAGPSPRSSIRWGAVDASVPDRPEREFAMLGFDEIRFEPVSFSYLPASYASSRVTVTTEGVGALPEGQLALHY